MYLKLTLLWIFISCTESNIVIDHEGNSYKTVKIGNQVWMDRNISLKTNIKGKPVKFYFVNNDTNNISHGYLYTWDTIKELVPEGWHIPSLDEWNELVQYLGVNSANKLKQKSFEMDSGSDDINNSGFSAFPSGYWNDNGFDNLYLKRAIFWSSTSNEDGLAFALSLKAGNDTISLNEQHTHYAFSLRLLKNDE